MAGVPIAREEMPDQPGSDPPEPGAIQVVDDDAEARDSAHLGKHRDRFVWSQVVDHQRTVDDIERTVFERQPQAVAKEYLELRGGGHGRIRANGRVEDLGPAVEADDVQARAVVAPAGDQGQRDIGATRPDVEHRQGVGLARERSDRRTGQRHATEPSIDPAKVPEIVGERSVVIEGTVEQLEGIGKAVHRAVSRLHPDRRAGARVGSCDTPNRRLVDSTGARDRRWQGGRDAEDERTDRTSGAMTAGTGPLSATDLDRLHAYWRAANYLSVGQIYLLDNPLLREPLLAEHTKPRLLGHWGTTPGLNFIYAHMNRVIRNWDLDAIYVIGPGHGGPAIVANAYLEGTYSEVYPSITRDTDGMRRLFRQFSFPGGIPSHVAPETPGSIHEGGELGYALSHAYGAAFDNPDLVVCCVVGDGEAETGPLATSWHSNKFLNPVNDGAVLPILHLNGYKIANPTVLARIPEAELLSLMEGYGHHPYVVAGRRSRRGPPADGRCHGHRGGGDPRDPASGPRRLGQGPAPLADDHPADAEGLDRPEGDRGQEDRGDMARPPSADGRGSNECRASRHPRGLDAELPAGRVVRRGRGVDPRAGRAGAAQLSTHEREPACQRRPAAARPGAAGLQGLRGEGRGAGCQERRGHPGHGHLHPRRHRPES